MKKFALVCGILALATIWLLSSSKPKPIYNVVIITTDEEIQEVVNRQPILPTFISQLNENNTKIRSITTELRTTVNGNTMRLRGNLAYQKNKLFRMQINSFMGKEIDIGSDATYFWFYSRRMDEPGLYYAHYSDIARTRLKTPFHPLWLMESLGIAQIKNIQSISKRTDGLYQISEIRQDIIGKLVKKITLIDSSKPAIVGHYLFDLEGVCIASSEITEFFLYEKVYVPKTIQFIWREEQQYVVFEFNNIKINHSISPQMWHMPKMKRMIYMTN